LEHVKLNRLGFYIFPSGFYFWYQIDFESN
jgi:hypothetical protein